MKKSTLINLAVIIGALLTIWGLGSYIEILAHSLDTGYTYSNYNLILIMLKIIPVITR